MSSVKEYADVEGLDDGLAVEYNFSENEDSGVEIEEEKEVEEKEVEEKEDEEKEDEVESGEEENVSSSSNKRKSESTGPSKKKARMEAEKEEKKALSTSKNDIIMEKLNKQIMELNPNLSVLELTELYLKKDQIFDTSEFEDRSLFRLEEFINKYISYIIPSIAEFKKIRNKIKKFETKRKFNKKFNKTVEVPKRKFLLILSISAIRSCDIHRATKNFEGGSVKLISKNPINQDLKMLKTTWSRILTSTPGRVDKILEISKQDEENYPDRGYSLHYDEIDTIVLDNFIDPKLRSVLEWKETFDLIKKIKDANPEIKIYVY